MDEKLLVGRLEAARMLSIGERLLWDLTKAGEIPHVRLGRRVLYSPEDLRAYIDQQRSGRALAAEGGLAP